LVRRNWNRPPVRAANSSFLQRCKNEKNRTGEAGHILLFEEKTKDPEKELTEAWK